MDDEAGPSRVNEPVNVHEDDTVLSGEAVKERKLRAKRQRIDFLDHLARELDTIIFLLLITIYYLDCSFFWFMVRALIHLTLFTPLPNPALNRQHEENIPFLSPLLVSFLANFILHLTFPAPSAGEDTRGYLHGGLMIDFIGQEGPTSKLKLAGLDICLLVLQLVMLSVHVKRRDLKKRLANSRGITETSPPGDGREANLEQDADSEERGILRRTDTLSDVDDEIDEEDALLPRTIDESSRTGTDLLDGLASGQVIIAELYPLTTLRQEHRNYEASRQSGGESATTSSLSPQTLRQLQDIRARLGMVGV
ncbi:DUF1746-domain-containing protein [Delitschia confertaspora ATCC 74209]|uniref:DUF1746-domain-containing protein n=1 Tax=Delitschia confertaspora ATCC 74209 TaxID=1513339 RepID=A0A9P4JLR8_9PLEO|nr:DUF1746-domain-containing protein [Delitschia confertaspora ATCC 74209]